MDRITEKLTHIDAYAIQQYQQNRYPLLFVDEIEEAVPGQSARGYKNFTYNEWFFPAHFEDEPNVPGFVQIVPGNRLDVEAELHRFRRGLAQGISKGYVKGELACQAELQIAIPDVMLQYRPVGGK